MVETRGLKRKRGGDDDEGKTDEAAGNGEAPEEATQQESTAAQPEAPEAATQQESTAAQPENQQDTDSNDERDLSSDEKDTWDSVEKERDVGNRWTHKDYWKELEETTDKMCETVEAALAGEDLDAAKTATPAVMEFLRKIPYFCQNRREIDLKWDEVIGPFSASKIMHQLGGAYKYMAKVSYRAAEIQNDLESLCALTQAEASQVTEYGPSQEDNVQMTDNDPGVGPKGTAPVCRVLANLIGSSKAEIELPQELKTLDEDLHLGRVPFLSVFSPDSVEKSAEKWDLKEVSDVYQTLTQGEKLDPSVEDYGVDINAAVEALEEVDKEKANGAKFPGPKSHEEDGAHPVFRALLNAIIANMQEGGRPTSKTPKEEVSGQNPVSATSSPQSKSPKASATDKYESPLVRTDVVPEAVIEGVILPETGRHKRRADFAFTKRGRYEVVFRDDGMELLIEWKPGCRKGIGPMELLQEVREQGIAHVAKAIIQGLHFSGTGVPIYATVVVGTSAYVEVLRLELFAPGTPEAQFYLFSTNPLPLMTPTSFDNWYGSYNTEMSAKQKEEVGRLRQLLYNGRTQSPHGVPLHV